MRLLLLTLLLLPSLALARGPAPGGQFTPSARTVTYGGVEWPAYFQGSLTYTLAETYDGNDPHTPWCQDGAETVTVQVRLDFDGTDALGERMKYTAAEGSWSASGGCHGHHTWTAMDGNTPVACSWTVDESYSGSGSMPGETPEGLEHTATLYLGRTTPEAALFYLAAGRVSIHNRVDCDTAWPGGIGDADWTESGDKLFTTGFGDDQMAAGSYSGSGGEMRVVLAGTRRATQPIGGVYTRVTTRTWSGGLGPRALELVIEPLDYDHWTPAAGRDEWTPGNHIAVRARLQYDDGGPADLEAERFRFSLTGTSREPGIAINRPLQSAGNGLDLQFAPERNAGQTITAEGQQLETAAGGTEWTAYVSAYDWGAWGEVGVVADMGNGWTLTGRWARNPADETVRLPQREPDSHVARAWLADHGVAGQADASDQEGEPTGDGHGGDGLTLYEEYRGFYEDGRHRTADPRRKDVFLFDEVGGVSKQAIALFQAGTGLAVHHEFFLTEYDPNTRVVNVNHGAGAHLADQHGVRIVAVGGDRTAAEAVSVDPNGGIGTPGGVLHVAIPQQMLQGGQVWRDLGEGEGGRGRQQQLARYMASTIAHELGHAVNVYHHGQTDRMGVRWSIPENAFGGWARDEHGELVVVEAGTGQVQLRDEAGAVRVPRTLRTTGLMTIDQMGVPGGQHSGDEGCFMRYDNAGAAMSGRTPGLRYVGFSETTGRGLCRTPVGTGVNADGHAPEPRYSDATRGACVHQICVNDRHH